jgi:hypothetical protein
MNPGRTSRWPRTRQNRGPCTRRTAEPWLRSRKLAVFTTAMNGEQREHGRSRRNLYPGTGLPIRAARRDKTHFCAPIVAADSSCFLMLQENRGPNTRFAFVCGSPIRPQTEFTTGTVSNLSQRGAAARGLYLLRELLSPLSGVRQQIGDRTHRGVHRHNAGNSHPPLHRSRSRRAHLTNPAEFAGGVRLSRRQPLHDLRSPPEDLPRFPPRGDRNTVARRPPVVACPLGRALSNHLQCTRNLQAPHGLPARIPCSGPLQAVCTTTPLVGDRPPHSS